jgi:hypothetical protein
LIDNFIKKVTAKQMLKCHMSCLSDLKLKDGLQILQSLSATRWSARAVNLKIVYRCLPAVLKFLETQTDAESRELLVSLRKFDFIFGV